MLNIATKYNYSIVSNIMDANAVDQLRQDRSYVEKIFSNSNFDDLIIVEIIKDIYDYSFNLRSEIVSIAVENSLTVGPAENHFLLSANIL